MNNRKLLSVLLVVTALLLVACGSDQPAEPEMEEMQMEETQTDDMQMDMSEVPADLDTSTSRMSEDEQFQVSISSDLDPLTINQIHSWRLHLETPDGQPVDNAQIRIDGGMPQHNHGFPTVPETTQFLGDGDYLVEGVRFNMPGWWEMRFEIEADGRQDTVTFNIVME